MIRIRLGYSDDSPDPVLSADRQEIADDLLLKLDSIDSQIDAALGDSMANQVGDLVVDYAKHLGILRSQATLYLNRLAQVAGLEVVYNPYTGKSVGQLDPTLAIRSFW